MGATPKWGVQLLGHPFDLENWADALTPNFDPWVERSGDEFVLRWSGFDGLETDFEVQGDAQSLVDRLNGAMRIHRATQPIRFVSVIAFKPDGARDKTVILGSGKSEARSRASAVGVAIQSDGTIAPPPAPEPSDVQKWAGLAQSHELLADALVYFGRGEWFDIFKAIECLRDEVGGQAALENLNWIKKTDLTGLRQTANSFRHRSGSAKNAPPKRPVTPEEARQLLSTLIRKAFIRAAPP